MPTDQEITGGRFLGFHCLVRDHRI